jgi:hypothetical protein
MKQGLSLANSETASASLGSFCVSAARYRGAENVGVVSVVISELEFGNIQRQIFAADFVEAAHDAALQERPKAIDGLRMDNAVNILPGAMADGLVLLQIPITGMFISSNQADFLRDRFADEAVQSVSVGMFDDARYNIAFALCGTNDGFLAFAASPFGPLIPMAVPILAADVGLINLNNAHELAEVGIGKASADAVAHIVRGRVGAEAHNAVNLKGRNALLARQHQIDDLEPRFERNVCVFKDCADKHGKAISSFFNALRALPMERPIGDGMNVLITTTRTANTFWPAARDKILLAGVIIREQFFKLWNRHLLSEFDAHCSALHA